MTTFPVEDALEKLLLEPDAPSVDEVQVPPPQPTPPQISIQDRLERASKAAALNLSELRSPEWVSALDNWRNLQRTPPWEHLHYSVNVGDHVALDRSEAKVFLNRPVNYLKKFDLSRGWRRYEFVPKTARPPGGSKLEAIRLWEVENNRKLDADVIFSRHTMVQLMCHGFGLQGIDSGSKVILTRFKGRLHVELYKKTCISRSPGTMAGYNFEQIMTERQFVPPTTNATKYNSMVMHQITIDGKTVRVLSSSEADACKLLEFNKFDAYSVLNNYLELKLWVSLDRKRITKARIQCYLGGVSTLVVGHRDPQSHHLLDVVTVDALEKAPQRRGKLTRACLRKYMNRLLAYLIQWLRLLTEILACGNDDVPEHFVLVKDGENLTIKPTTVEEHPEVALMLSQEYVQWANTLEEGSESSVNNTNNGSESSIPDRNAPPARHKKSGSRRKHSHRPRQPREESQAGSDLSK